MAVFHLTGFNWASKECKVRFGAVVRFIHGSRLFGL
jgi:hypothetical protein